MGLWWLQETDFYHQGHKVTRRDSGYEFSSRQFSQIPIAKGTPKPESSSPKPVLLHGRTFFFRRTVAAQQLRQVL